MNGCKSRNNILQVIDKVEELMYERSFELRTDPVSTDAAPIRNPCYLWLATRKARPVMRMDTNQSYQISRLINKISVEDCNRVLIRLETVLHTSGQSKRPDEIPVLLLDLLSDEVNNSLLLQTTSKRRESALMTLRRTYSMRKARVGPTSQDCRLNPSETSGIKTRHSVTFLDEPTIYSISLNN